jgi:hypothetical protein
MGKCASIITEVRFVIDDELTQCYVAVRAEGDCPIGVQGWHHKTFPKSKSIEKILPEMAADYLVWSQEAPDETAA